MDDHKRSSASPDGGDREAIREVRLAPFSSPLGVQEAASVFEPTARGRGKTAPHMEVRDLVPEPPLRRHLLFDQAHRLATMPRKKQDEFSQSAFWSALVSVPGGVAGFLDIMDKTPTQPKILDLTEVTALAVCVALFVFAVVKPGKIETSEEYLNKLYGIQPAAPSRRRWYLLWLA